MTVTLTSAKDRTGQRHFNLRLNQPVVVGRSSLSTEKGLHATSGNALYDSPVVSRKHAELELHYDFWSGTNKVTVKDTRSMHGTYVNEAKLLPGRPFTLASGDEIRLGDRVSRGASKYTSTTNSSNIADNDSCRYPQWSCDQIRRCDLVHQHH